MNIRNKLILLAVTAVGVLALPASASAHVVVSPKEVNVAAYQTFTVSVPNEKDNAVTGVRVVIPDGVNGGMPTVKPGWEAAVKKDGDKVTEIAWTGGVIPTGQRDDFSFSAQAPEKESTLQWKAYQTYEDGTEVSWDQDPSKSKDEEGGNAGPYSTTAVVNDLKKDTAATSGDAAKSGNATGAYALAGVALAVALVSLTIKKRS